jgi:hypothetical protein
MPPGVSSLGAIRSSGIGPVSSSSSPSVKVGSDAGALGLASSRAGPLRSSCSCHSRCASDASRSSGQLGRSMAALYWQIASHASSRVIRPSCAMRT